MVVTTTNTADSAIPELWSALTADSREENLLYANLFDRKYEAEAKGKAYDIIRIQSVGNFTAPANLGVGGTVTFDAGVFNAQVILTINTHVYQAFDIEFEAELMTNISLMEKLSGKAGYSVALNIDDVMAGFVDNFTANTVGTQTVPLTDANVRTAVRMLNDAIAPEDSRYHVFSPSQHMEYLSIDKYVNALYKPAVGNVDSKHFRGFVGSLYGMDWYVTGNVEGTNAAGRDNGAWQKEAVALAIVDHMRTATVYWIETDSTRHVVHAIFGAIAVRDDHGVFMRGA